MAARLFTTTEGNEMQVTRPYNMTENEAHELNKLRKEFFADETRDGVNKQMDQRLGELKGETLVRRIKVGRNHACPCGSGRKFKKCCINQLRNR